MFNAKYFRKISNSSQTIASNVVECNLCPKKCIIENSKTGDCKVRINVQGFLKTLNYAKLTAIAVDPIEKKPLYHFFCGSETLSIGSFGCNFSCLHCQNHNIAKVMFNQYDTYEIYPETLIQIAKDKQIDIISYTYNEPTVYFEYVLESAKLAKKNNLKNVIVTNGYIQIEPLKELLEYIDAFNVDVKGFSDKFYSSICQGKLEPVLNSIKTIYEYKKHIELTYLIIQDLNDSNDEIKKFCEWVKDNLDLKIPLHFSRFFPMHKMQNKNPTSIKKLEEAFDIAKKTGFENIYIGNVDENQITKGHNTYCPKCNKILIKRNQQNISYDKNFYENQKCDCNTLIYGTFK